MPKRRPINLARLNAYPDNKKLTREQAADLMGCSPATIAVRNYSGLLPYSPTRPITVLAGDLKVLGKMLANGVADQLHRGLRIKPEDCPTYSRLDGVQSLTYAPPDVVISKVVKSTHQLFLKYKTEDKGHATPKRTRRTKAARVV